MNTRITGVNLFSALLIAFATAAASNTAKIFVLTELCKTSPVPANQSFPASCKGGSCSYQSDAYVGMCISAIGGQNPNDPFIKLYLDYCNGMDSSQQFVLESIPEFPNVTKVMQIPLSNNFCWSVNSGLPFRLGSNILVFNCFISSALDVNMFLFLANNQISAFQGELGPPMCLEVNLSNPLPTSSPTPSVSPSNLPLVQQIYLKTENFASSTCSGPASTRIHNFPTCDNTTQPPYSFSYVCSSGSALKFAYGNAQCFGQPTLSSNVSSPGCEANSYGSSTTQCGTSQFQIPPNSFVTQQFLSSLSCQVSAGSSIIYMTYPLDTCFPTGSGGSQSYSCSPLTGTYNSFSNPTCNGQPDSSSNVPLRVCSSTSSGNDSYIISCTGQSTPSPSSTPSSIENNDILYYTIIGIAGGGFFFILLLCCALHAFRLIKVPCFNVCFDRRPLNLKAITTYPVIVTGQGIN